MTKTISKQVLTTALAVFGTRHSEDCTNFRRILVDITFCLWRMRDSCSNRVYVDSLGIDKGSELYNIIEEILKKSK